MKVSIMNQFEGDKLDEIEAVYHSVGWVKHTNDVISKVFQRSDVISIAVCDGRIVGVGRALTDGVFNAAIYDIVVHRDHQRKGIASQIMKNLLEQLKDISCIQLIATTGNEAFYRKFGMENVKTGMARYLNPDLANEYLK
ncbi:GNAT family N-acetyltransferase [Bacillus sp. AFS015802]|uniref:GNAT family N-acetyltransferase n=1 Tax=Bacillus sp. AFS015802 TaxID=2033486 RepID=UPI000BF59567|nr:GNAT family N-acetyltransferase [Bacillus sp. AFS015802]PFA67707.1 GNAT family N-acetyltransferase [Bacillus sp. AFS015802]